jgi:hypothetical protein
MVPPVVCPKCHHPDAQAYRLHYAQGVKTIGFQCPQCGHEWTEPLPESDLEFTRPPDKPPSD